MACQLLRPHLSVRQHQDAQSHVILDDWRATWNHRQKRGLESVQVHHADVRPHILPSGFKLQDDLALYENPLVEAAEFPDLSSVHESLHGC